MKNRGCMLIPIILGFAATSSSLMAQQKITIFDVADTNKDGYVDKSEHEAANLEKFKSRDTNGDGKLSKDEIAAHFKGLPETEVARGVSANLSLMDTDGDGSISLQEFQTWYYDKMFSALDQDHDDRLSKSEFILNEDAP